jgi:lysozyme
MAETVAIDVSRWQGDINWSAVTAPIALIKMSGGDDGVYYDSKASRNYALAKSTGKAVGMYHFAGAKDPIVEADFFISSCSPLEKDDVMILDWEVAHPNPVEWCRIFIQRVIDKTGTRPLIYMNTSTENRYDWSPVVNQNVGLWVADYRYAPSGNVPIKHWPTYVMHQYTSSGSMAGVAGNVDMNVWFGTVDQFKKYGYQPASQPPPVVLPPVIPPVTPPPVVTPPIEPPVIPPVEPPVVPPVVTPPTLLDWIKSLVSKVIDWLKGWHK